MYHTFYQPLEYIVGERNISQCYIKVTCADFTETLPFGEDFKHLRIELSGVIMLKKGLLTQMKCSRVK